MVHIGYTGPSISGIDHITGKGISVVTEVIIN